ncbi:MAG: phosphatase PAP2 family protein, partial [Candidatus Kapaibacterium sp.]
MNSNPVTLNVILYDNRYFFIPYAIFLLFGGIALTVYPKGEILIWLNGHHSDFLDHFFKYFTLLGDGMFFLFFLLPLMMVKIRFALHGLSAYLMSGMFAQIFKRFFNEPRPKKWFAEVDLLHFVEGVNVHSYYSFPSGHTSAGFSLFLFLSFIIKNNYLKSVFFLMAVCVGFSRVYLLQHFFIDIYFGSVVGVVFTTFCYLLFVNWRKL